jgi:hypothetical protein
VRALPWLLLPLWAAQVFSGEKRCDRNPILGSMTLNRRGLHVWRARLAHRLAEARRRRLAPLVSAQDRAAFTRDGVVVKPGFASPELFARVLSELEGFAGEGWETREGDALTRTIPLTRASLLSLPAVRELVNSPEWRGLLRYVASFDAEPSLFVQTVFSHARAAKPDPQTKLHMDTFHPTMKAWLYLQDVPEEAGPFLYVPGSHRRTPRRDAWERRRSIEAADPANPSAGGSYRIPRADLPRLHLPEPRPMSAPANTLIVADTCGFHARGVSAAPGRRIALYASCRRNPFRPWAGLNLSAPGWLEGVGWRLKWRAVGRKRVVGGRGSGSRGIVGVSAGEPPAAWAD